MRYYKENDNNNNKQQSKKVTLNEKVNTSFVTNIEKEKNKPESLIDKSLLLLSDFYSNLFECTKKYDHFSVKNVINALAFWNSSKKNESLT